MKAKKSIGYFPAIAAILCVLSLPAAARIDAVASVPCLGDMVREIGGERVKVEVLASGHEELHAVPARPSFLPRLHRADLLFSLGLEAEHAWLPALAAEARNPRIRPGGEGWIETSKGIDVVDVPERFDRSEGEQHPQGNPHYNISPASGKTMARTIAAALKRADPEGAGAYEKRTEAYLGRVEELEGRLLAEGAGLKGVKIVSNHPDVSYLAPFYGMKIVGSLEPKLGVPPTAAHLHELTERARAEGVRLVLYNQAQNDKLARRFAADVGAAAVEFLNMAGSRPEAKTWMALQEYNLDKLLAGLHGAKAK